MSILFRGAIVVIFAANGWQMKQEYDKQNLTGVVYFGFWSLISFMGLCVYPF